MNIGWGFDFMQMLFPIFFAAFLFAFVFIMVKAIKEKRQNDASPRLTVQSVVQEKRRSVSQTQHANAGDASGAHGFSTTTDTTYHVTFRVESGDELRFRVSHREYDELAEGDAGWLKFQGTRYLGFDRQDQWKEQMPRM